MTSLSNIGDKGGLPHMVYVISKAGKPLMPTERHGKLRLIERAKTVMLERREERNSSPS